MKMIGSLALASVLLGAPVALTPAAAMDTNAAKPVAACEMPSCDTCDTCCCGADCTR